MINTRVGSRCYLLDNVIVTLLSFLVTTAEAELNTCRTLETYVVDEYSIVFERASKIHVVVGYFVFKIAVEK
jgi:hypothetical protein